MLLWIQDNTSKVYHAVREMVLFLFAWLTFSSGGWAQSRRDQAWFLPPPPQHRRIRSLSHKYPTLRSFMLQELHQVQLGGRL